MPHRLRSALCGLGAAVILGPLLLLGCDTAPSAPPAALTPPRVADFALEVEVVPDPDLPDTLAAIQLEASLRAADSDGQVVRTEMTVEPSQAPAATTVLTLPNVSDDRYGQIVTVVLPATLDERYTVRAYAIDNDSLVSNQVRGQFRIVPATAE